MESRMQGHLHVRFGERDEETRHRKVRERFIPTLHLHCKSHVGTTYKRALTRFHRDQGPKVASDFSCIDRKRVGQGKSVSVTVDTGGRGIITIKGNDNPL